MPNNETEPKATSNLALLYAYCEKESVPKPSFFHELVEEEPGGSKKYKVWAEKESQRFELQALFLTVEEGQERLAKRVLLREQKLATKKETIWTKRYIRLYFGEFAL